MRILSTVIGVGLVVAAVHSPHLIGETWDAATSGFAAPADAAPQDQKTYDRICPLFDVWDGMDADGKQATAKSIKALVRHQSHGTEDPALRAFLHVVPAALAEENTARSKAARALIDRECRAHSE